MTDLEIYDGCGVHLLGVLMVQEEEITARQPLTHAVVLARHLGKTLLVFNRYKQHWELARGTIADDETARACAARELREESGLVCAENALRFVCGLNVLVNAGGDGRVEFGVLYTVDIDAVHAFSPNDEIGAVMWWDGLQRIEGLSPIDEALLRQWG